MNRLQELIEEINDKRAFLSLEPEKIDPNVRATFEGQQRQAKADLDVLEETYRNEVINNIIVIGVEGPEASQFVDIAKESSIVVNYNQIVEDLEDTLKSRLAPEPYDSNSHFMLLEELQRIKLKYNILRLPMPVINAANDGVYGTTIKNALITMFKKNYGGGLQTAIARKQIGQIALDSQFAGKKVPVFLYNIVGPVDKSFIPEPVTIINIDNKDIDKKYVEGKLVEIKGLIKQSLKKESV